MTRIWLIRHGSHDWLSRVLVGRTRGVHLNELGREEASRVARALAERSIAAIYSSPRERAMETAAPLATIHDLVTEEAADLDEIDFGEWCGLSFEELAKDDRWRQWNTSRGSAEAPGGETMVAVRDRALRFIERAAAMHDGEEIALFSHGDVIRGALTYFLNQPLDSLLAIDFPPAAMAMVEFDGRGKSVQIFAKAGLGEGGERSPLFTREACTR